MKPIHYIGIAGGIVVLFLLLNRSQPSPYGGTFGGLMGGSGYNGSAPWYAQLGIGLGALSGGIAKQVWGDSSDAGYSYKYTPGMTL